MLFCYGSPSRLVYSSLQEKKLVVNLIDQKKQILNQDFYFFPAELINLQYLDKSLDLSVTNINSMALGILVSEMCLG